MLSHFSHVQLCATLWLNPPVSSVREILQARILEWVTMPSSRGSSQPKDGTQVSRTAAAAAAKSLRSCPTLCNPIDGSPPGSPCPWDSPGKNTGVGCHFLLQCMKVKSLSCVQLFETRWTAAYQAPLSSMGFSTKEYWSGLLIRLSQIPC